MEEINWKYQLTTKGFTKKECKQQLTFFINSYFELQKISVLLPMEFWIACDNSTRNGYSGK